MTGSTSLQALLAYDRLDIGNYIATRLTIPDGLKPELLQKPWIPPHQYDFPKYLQKVKGKDRFSCFQYNWFNKFNWLMYSVAKNGSFCKFCVLFAPTSVAGPSLGLHIEVAFSRAQHYVSQRRLLCEHAGKGYHLTAALKLEGFLATLSSSTVVDNLSTASQQLLKSKKDYLEGFASVMHLLGKQNIAYCGHFDSKSLSVNSLLQHKEGNLKTIINLLVARGDFKLTTYIEQASKNAIYLSWKTQDEFINIISN